MRVLQPCHEWGLQGVKGDARTAKEVAGVEGDAKAATLSRMRVAGLKGDSSAASMYRGFRVSVESARQRTGRAAHDGARATATPLPLASCAAASSSSPESGLSIPVERWDPLAEIRGAPSSDKDVGSGGRGGVAGEGREERRQTRTNTTRPPQRTCTRVLTVRSTWTRPRSVTELILHAKVAVWPGNGAAPI